MVRLNLCSLYVYSVRTPTECLRPGRSTSQTGPVSFERVQHLSPRLFFKTLSSGKVPGRLWDGLLSTPVQARGQVRRYWVTGMVEYWRVYGVLARARSIGNA